MRNMLILTAYYGGEKFIVNPRTVSRAYPAPEDAKATRLVFVGGDISTVKECFEHVAGLLGASA